MYYYYYLISIIVSFFPFFTETLNDQISTTTSPKFG